MNTLLKDIGVLKNMISKKFIYLLVLTIGILFLLQASTPAKVGVKDINKNNNVHKSLDQVARTFMDINNISTQFYNNGIGDIDPSGNSGCVYPKGSGKTCVFTSGLLWGGFVQGDPQVRVGGTAYRTGLQPGAILSNGLADDNTLSKYRIYRVRPDVKPGGPAVDLSAEASNENTTTDILRTQYEADWREWPGNSGAPYTDVNGDGVYDPTVDIPGVPGADMTVWYVANDMSSTTSTYLYGAQPMGIEMQATYWAYSQTGALGNMYFRKYRLVNKGADHNTISDMYLSFFADVDDGDSGDDFVGVDTTRSLQYCYNAAATDAVYNPLPPPAVGFDFFQGPLAKGVAGQDLNKNGIDDAQDYAIFNGKKVGPGYINLPMTAAYYFANGDLNIGDPPQGDLQGSTQFYNFFRGRYGTSGAPFIDPTTGQVTTFALNGDPQTRKGWIDGSQLPAGDRRQGSASGPFTLAPGDTQEVVIAELVAGAQTGVDRLAAIGLLKFYDDQAQLAYNNFFNLPTAPPAPIVKITPLDKEIVLDWGEDTSTVLTTERNVTKGYSFEGYNVYQLPSASATIDQAVRLATYDVVDNILKIEDQFFDPKSGVVAVGVKQFGNDTGIKRFIDITSDQVKGGIPLVDGIKYYYAVTAYSYNPDPTAVPNNLENPIAIFTVVPQSPNPGVNIPTPTGAFNNVIHKGTADGSVSVTTVDPTKITGDIYQVFFNERSEIRNPDGDWIPASSKKFKSVRGNFNKPDTLTGSSIDLSATYGPQTGVTSLNFTLNLVSQDKDNADGIKLVLPAGVTIVSFPQFSTNNSATIIPKISGNVIALGDTAHGFSGNGPFAGDETWSILVKGNLPIAADWTIYDDGAAGGPVDASGTTTVSTIGSIARTAKYWNVKDSTTGLVKAINQSIVAGVDLYPRRNDIPVKVGVDANPIIDGLQIGVDIGYESPIEFLSTKLIPAPSSTTVLANASTADTVRLSIVNYTIYGYPTSHAFDDFGKGTTDINELQKDYILKFTGVWDSTVNSTTGQIDYFVKSGGQMATLYYANNYDLKDNPFNTAAASAPFLVRIPFEVWNKDDNRQVNLVFRDRASKLTDHNFFAWNIDNRNYSIIINSAYDSTTAIPGPNALATWVLVFYGTHYTLGDQVVVTYANPIQLGKDTYTFQLNAKSYNNSQAKTDVQRINVFPNPYYGVNSEELNKYNRFVTFNHLPAIATIRIFNLAGVLVQTIEKNDPGQFARWDLNNQSNLPVASGLYIAYVDMPGLGTTKILKIAIIQEQQILDRF
ncbi:MAG: T9SS type A sorting domain-containing protein [Ignavibacteriaceae bacterium]|nr:T9SS type A sorting domain-containing protein [Ignavibacteriaceae bacterium]